MRGGKRLLVNQFYQLRELVPPSRGLPGSGLPPVLQDPSAGSAMGWEEEEGAIATAAASWGVCGGKVISRRGGEHI